MPKVSSSIIHLFNSDDSLETELFCPSLKSLLKRIEDLDKLGAWPEWLQNRFSVFQIVNASLIIP
jgi:hypothetical protein